MTLTAILIWIIVGLIAGALAKSVVPGEGPGGILGDIIIGVIGAFIGGWLFSNVFHIHWTGFIGWIIEALIGAIVLLLIIRLISGRRTVA
ncbi:MAG: GlsB/YeaQ/YmgE family stress response membrane protein [Candidatus Eremiobacteraeota bacterium]|nr:GlsB/YeaQ/YmgE family stress response membrane protein [Candidatus Eremiobacteraeota bacterium]MBV9736869.1 GlsB/YeaQ/YmgE family stress response membrane protein [Candidatus Eremiobacteraeota bacterium]